MNKKAIELLYEWVRTSAIWRGVQALDELRLKTLDFLQNIEKEKETK